MAILGSTTGGLTTELGSGIVSGCLTIPGSVAGVVGSCFGCSARGWIGAGDSGGGIISAAKIGGAKRLINVRSMIRFIPHAIATSLHLLLGDSPALDGGSTYPSRPGYPSRLGRAWLQSSQSFSFSFRGRYF